jgi:hypothetical protein
MNYKQLNEAVSSIQNVIGNQETKVQKKLFKIFSKLKPTLEKYQDEVETLRLDNASVDDKGVLFTDEKGNYKFSKEGIAKLKKQVKELGEKEITFEKINVVNPQGLETFTFLEDLLTGVEFQHDEEEEL